MANNLDNKAPRAEPSTPGAGVEYSLPSEEPVGQTSTTFNPTAADSQTSTTNPTILHHAQDCQDDDGDNTEYEDDGDNDEEDEDEDEGINDEEDEEDDEDEPPCHIFLNEETKEINYYCSEPLTHAYYRRASLEEFQQYRRSVDNLCVCRHYEMCSCTLHWFLCAAQQDDSRRRRNLTEEGKEDEDEI